MTAAIGLGMGFRFRLIGDVFPGELLTLVCLPFALSARLHRHKRLRLLLWLGIAWLAGQIVTDAIRGSVPYDYLRGWANITIFLVDLLVLNWLLRGKPDRQLWFAASLAGGLAIGALINPNVLAQVDFWKFGLATPVSLVALCTCAFILGSGRSPLRTSMAAAVLAALVAVNLLLNYRSEAGFLGLTLALLLMVGLTSGRVPEPGKASNSLRGLAALAGCLAVGALLVTGYSSAAADGLLGPQAQAKYFMEYQPGLAIILGGRGEILVSSQAIQDSPVIGHGSWPHDYRYVAIGASFRAQGFNVGEVAPTIGDSDVIPSHSHLFGAWVEAGIIGAIFWMYVLSLCLRGLIRMPAAASRMLPLVAYAVVRLSWDILFSPFSGSQRILDSFAIALLLSNLWAPGQTEPGARHRRT